MLLNRAARISLGRSDRKSGLPMNPVVTLSTHSMFMPGVAPHAGVRLRNAMLLILALVLVPWSRSEAQRERERRIGGIPRDISLEVTRLFNAPATRRVRGDFVLPAVDTVAGDLAVLNGNVRLRGIVNGQVIVLNGDVVLEEGSRIGLSLTVLGGTFESPERPNVGGEIRVWSSRYRYREEADSLVAETDFFARWSQWARDDGVGGSDSQLFLTTAHTYNRVEGLPIIIGPRYSARSQATRIHAEVFGIFRTGDGLRWDHENLGHRALFEIRNGTNRGVAIGSRLFDEVSPVERWQLTEAEVGLNAFLFARDYRDYWQRHGGLGYVSLYAGRGSELTASWGRERWSSRRMRDVWSMFSGGTTWRGNPAADEGVVGMLTLTGTFDTRTNPVNPRSGWFMRGEWEHGSGTIDRLGALTEGVRPAAGTSMGSTSLKYSRALLDVRRYNRLGPQAQLNLRVVAGGWLSGDPLPVQRRVSVSGIDALPGFDFRRHAYGAEAGTCATGPEDLYIALGRPAQCDRIVLTQVEWKGDFRISLFGDDDFGDRRWGFSGFHGDGTWVIFANAGRGWLVRVAGSADSGPASDLMFARNSLPSPGSWNTDIGGGFDFGDFGVYVAQAVSRNGISPNVYMRLARRF